MSQTRPIRRAALKLVPNAPPTESKQDRRIVHDARGTAVWVGEHSALEDLASLTLVADASARPVIDGDPYNRPARAFGPGAAGVLKGSAAKRRR